ncbi:type II toxin-antitoxin system VapC family toxin [Methyloglobulus sp.]|uniref:type II toxin-antitoxin system VapC family toxin n=1 Tax=Methyloglobulus sp. TaxID=2518622 RepID=UPI003988D578
MSAILINTDVLIDYLRGLEDAKNFIASLPEQAYISAITVAELHVGVRNGKERAALTEFLDTLDTIALDAELAAEGGLLRRDYGKSHGVGLNDALIAATVLKNRLQLVTLNGKHYPMVKNVLVPYQKV